MSNKPVVTVDLGGTNLRIALVVGDEVVNRHIFPTPRGAEAIVGLIAQEALAISSASSSDIEGIAIAAPGAASRKLGGLSKAPNLPELNGYPMAAQVTKLTSLPCIVENDANAYAAGEVVYGAAKGMQTVVVITLGTGVGGGIVLEGKLWRGVDGSAAEVGHICIEENGRLCGCGAKGCVEAYSSATSMAKLAREYGVEASSAREAYDLAKQGNEAALKAFHRAGTALGIVVAGLVNTLNPQAVVIGGGGSSSFDLLEPGIWQELKIRAFPVAVENLKLVKCTLKNYAGLLGAAALLRGLA
ncbi:MAG: ROK family protein [Blastocatellia bacterium]|nr:ROK family protein [Blastocatellia bacterium]